MCFGSGLKGEPHPDIDATLPIRQVSLSSSNALDRPPTNSNPVDRYTADFSQRAALERYNTQSTKLAPETTTMGRDMGGSGSDEVTGKGWGGLKMKSKPNFGGYGVGGRGKGADVS